MSTATVFFLAARSRWREPLNDSGTNTSSASTSRIIFGTGLWVRSEEIVPPEK